jgi:hypothetical protein
MSDDFQLQAQPTLQLEAEEELTVTVLHGYGRVSPTEKHYVDKTLFVGGVARHVPASVAKAWKAAPIVGRAIHVLADDAVEADFARASGIQPMATPKFAAMLNAIDLDKVAEELGPVRTREIAERLLAQSEPQVQRGADGKWRKKTTA